MIKHASRLENVTATDVVKAATQAVLLRTEERRWFGTQKAGFNPQAARAELLRPRSN